MLAPALDEEPPLLELCITDMKDPRFDPKDYTEYEIVLVRNRKNYVNAYLGNEPTCVQDTPSRGTNAGHWLRTCDYSCLQAQPKDWQQLTVNYAAPQQLALNCVDMFWKGAETLDGQTAFCGFIFLYNLLTGTIKCKIAMQDDSQTVAAFVGRSGVSSVLSILFHNPHLREMVPKFKDTRKMKLQTINGWTDENEASSPLDELFSTLLPILRSESECLLLFLPFGLVDWFD
ncbi:MAG: hypothetical protein IPL25_20410 [Saprospiraceae bacterium]|nr:hypothetical protein [Candidatus Vicinibacter affinis]